MNPGTLKSLLHEKAITLGATHIRVGTAIFGKRPQK